MTSTTSDVVQDDRAELSPTAHGVLNCVVALVLAAVTANVLATLLISWRWPLLHDSPLMHYVAWIIQQGGRPYVDAFDMNFPGTYLIHYAILSVPGDMDRNWRLFDLAMTLGTLALMARMMQPAGNWSRWIACVFFATAYLSGGPYSSGQRDMILIPFQLAGLIALVRFFERGGSPFVYLGLSGLLLGVACTIKPFGGAMVATEAAFLGFWSWRGGRSLGSAALLVALFCLAAALPMLAVLGWLWRIDSLEAFRDIVFNYLMPIYSHSSDANLFRNFAEKYLDHGPFVLMLALIVCVAVYRIATGSLSPRFGVLLVAALAALLHFFAQRKLWPYHVLPFYAFGAMAAFWHVGAVIGRRKALDWVLAVAIVLSIVCPGALLASWQTLKELRGVPPYHQNKLDRVRSLVEYLRPRLSEGDTVQVFDTTEGGLDALLRLKVRQPTRFLYDFQLLIHDPELPYIQALRQEMLRDLAARPPKFIVIYRVGFKTLGYDRLKQFPELAAWIDKRYTPAIEQDDYQVLERKEESG